MCPFTSQIHSTKWRNFYQVEKRKTTSCLLNSSESVRIFFQVPSSFLSVTRLFTLLAQHSFLTQPLARCDVTSYSTQGSAQRLVVWEGLRSSHPPMDFRSSSDRGTTAAADPLPTAPSANLVAMEKNRSGRTQTSVIKADIWAQSLKYFGFLGISSGKQQFTVKAQYFLFPLETSSML